MINIATPFNNIFKNEIESLNKERLFKLNKFFNKFNENLKPEKNLKALSTLKNFIKYFRIFRHIAIYFYIAVILKKGLINLTQNNFKKFKNFSGK